MGYEYQHARGVCSNYDYGSNAFYDFVGPTLWDGYKAEKFLKKACDGGYADACTELSD